MIWVLGSHALDMAVIQLFMACEVYSITTGYIKQQQQQQQHNLTWLQKAHLLLVPVLLHCPLELLPASANHRHQLFCSMVLLSAAQEAFQMAQWQKQRSDTSEQKDSHQLGSTPPAVWVSEMLPLTLKVTEVLTSQQQQQQQQLVTAGGAAGAPAQLSSASVSSSSSRGGDSDPEALAVIRTAATVESLLLLGLTVTASVVCEGDINADGSFSTAPADQVGAEQGRIMRAMEGAVRIISAGARKGTRLKPRARHAVKVLARLCGKGDEVSVFMVMLQQQDDQQYSELLRQYYSLLSTLLKFASCETVRVQEGLAAVQAGCCYSVASAAVQLLHMHAPGDRAGSSSSTKLLAPPNWQSAGSAIKTEAEHVLPSLVLLGRCLLQWAQQLPSEAPWLLQQRQQQEQQPLPEQSVADICLMPSTHNSSSSKGAASKADAQLVRLLAGLQGWLGDSHVVTLWGLGYDLQQLQQQLAALLAAQAAAQTEMSEGMITELAQQLQATGVLLSNVAVPTFCNNPSCSNVGGCSEVQLVSGRSCLCAGCVTGRYCSRSCQKQHLKQHKPVCKTLAAAAAAADRV